MNAIRKEMTKTSKKPDRQTLTSKELSISDFFKCHFIIQKNKKKIIPKALLIKRYQNFTNFGPSALLRCHMLAFADSLPSFRSMII